MIDLHCHILPGLDDGSPDLAVSLEMAKVAVADGIITMACTPHFVPGVYKNIGPIVRAAIKSLSAALGDAGIPLQLVTGADAHAAPDLLAGLRSGRVLTLNDSRYFLIEPPHDIFPPRFEELVFALAAAGYVPILTHPERLSWIEPRYTVVQRLARSGVLMQITAGSFTGNFGKKARYWAERMLDEGIVHIVATDAHNLDRRRPVLSEAREAVALRAGEDRAAILFAKNPLCILEDRLPSEFLGARMQTQSYAQLDAAGRT